MRSNTISLGGNELAVAALGVLGAILVFATLTGRLIPLISGDRAAVLALLVIGFAMCSLGSLRDIQPHEWLHPMNVLATLLGGLALMLGVAVLIKIDLPLISGDRTALLALAVIVLSKVILARLHRILMG